MYRRTNGEATTNMCRQKEIRYRFRDNVNYAIASYGASNTSRQSSNCTRCLVRIHLKPNNNSAINDVTNAAYNAS